eukprot:CAMPEP_0171558494 /NCGR_PEP_ID=MMETSP0960-20121227/12045_1 /TAXON_ID=87120 /ORGANISM="Aurantiochytrium limacinum, Strain ATCCMYA-1381" /LENGTH=326 /DNA_ID=CAMNT_0012109335 /DNA_START=27 /DNA_END=1004 /DNA_ORIENTATION=+
MSTKGSPTTDQALQQISSEPKSKRKTASSGGATSWPQLDPRPTYPAWGKWIYKTTVAYTRAPLLLALSCKATYPLYACLVKLLRSKGLSDAIIFGLFTCVTHSCSYSIFNGFFAACDRLKILQQYKLQAGRAQTPSNKLIQQTLFEAFLGQFVLGPILAVASFRVFRKMGMPELTSSLPSLLELYKSFVLAHLFNGFFFYWSHRLVHHKKLYRAIHKQHHNYIETIGIAAEYASPTEQIVANYIPSIGGVILFGRHPLIFFSWLFFRLVETYEAHSGYYFGHTWLAKIGLTNSENSAFHFSHHLQNRGNFGSWHMDYLFGTMDAWI